MINKLIILCAGLFLLSACTGSGKKEAAGAFVRVTADMETEPVKSGDDAADDPAIWVHPTDPAASLLVCSNKKSGIVVYDLSGVEKAHYEVGLINNVDVRQGIYLNDTTRIDIAAGSNRTDNTITVMGISPDGTLYDIMASKIQSAFSEVYGFCLYHDLASRTVYAIVNNKEGLVEQWRLFSRDGLKLEGELSRTFRAGATQLEGCVGDDELGWLYIGEEVRGFWKFRAHPDSAANGILIDSVKSAYLKEDIEGITILYGPEGKGYVIVSSQGNNSYAVYRREGANEYLGTFVIDDGESIDGVAETDGIDVLAQPLGPLFPQGIFIAQDGFNRDGGKAVNQNFKAVRWEKIREKLSLIF